VSKQLVATYRLQFREGTGFKQAEDLASYLRTLGVSHLYASPVFAAAPGSTHGYDVVDYNRFEEELGGEVGFNAMSDALMAHGLGLILDFVPNQGLLATSTHRSSSPEANTCHWKCRGPEPSTSSPSRGSAARAVRQSS
jgi:maltooligosyltrehalose synthase